MFSIKTLDKMINKLVCAKARELYTKYLEEGKDLYAEIIKESLPECFEK